MDEVVCPFGRDYQEHLILSCSSGDFLSRTAGVLNPDAFDSDLAPAVRRIVEFYRREGRAPTSAQFSRMVRGLGLPLVDSVHVSEFDVREVAKFSAHASLRRVVMSAMSALTVGDVDSADRCLRDHVSSPSGGSALKVFNLGETPVTRRGVGSVRTGFEWIDRMTGGVCPGECLAVMGASNSGKTSVLVQMGTRAAKAGVRVVHISLEMGFDQMGVKYLDAMGTPPSKGRRKSVMSGSGDVGLVCAPAGTLTVSEVESALMSAEDRPGLVIVDSIDNFRPSRSYSDRWAEEERVVQELLATASRLNCPCAVSMQANRPGFGVGVLDQQHVKGSMDKCRLMSQIITLNQDANEVIPDKDGWSVLRVYLAKNRYGIKGITERVLFNFSTCAAKAMLGSAGKVC